jgi:hypothetical protein
VLSLKLTTDVKSGRVEITSSFFLKPLKKIKSNMGRLDLDVKFREEAPQYFGLKIANVA